MYVSYFKNTCSLYIVTSLKYTYYDITIEIKNQPHIKMRHKRYVCKEVQPFLLQKMETIRQIRIEFEKYLLNIDPYKAIKQVCTCTLTPSTHPLHTLICNSLRPENRSIQILINSICNACN